MVTAADPRPPLQVITVSSAVQVAKLVDQHDRPKLCQLPNLKGSFVCSPTVSLIVLRAQNSREEVANHWQCTSSCGVGVCHYTESATPPFRAGVGSKCRLALRDGAAHRSIDLRAASRLLMALPPVTGRVQCAKSLSTFVITANPLIV